MVNIPFGPRTEMPVYYGLRNAEGGKQRSFRLAWRQICSSGLRGIRTAESQLAVGRAFMIKNPRADRRVQYRSRGRDSRLV